MQQVWMEEPVETDVLPADVLLTDVQPADAQPGAGSTGTDAKDEKANVPNPGEPEEGGVSTADRTEETDVSEAGETKVQPVWADEHLRMLEERLSSLTLALKASEEARRPETEPRQAAETRCSEMETLLSGLNARLTEAEGARAAAEETLARTKGQLSEVKAQLSEAQAQLAREGVRTQLMLALTDAGCLDREYLCDKLLAAAGEEIPGEIPPVSQLVEQGQKAHPALFFRPEVTGLPAAEGRALPGESPGASRWDARSLTALNLSQRARLFAEDPAGYALLRSR